MQEVDRFLTDESDQPPRVKRRAQAELIQDLWLMSFQKQLRLADATWLIGKFGSARATYNQMLIIKSKKVEFPLGYIKAGLKKQERIKKPDAKGDIEEYLKASEQASKYIKELRLDEYVDDEGHSQQTESIQEREESGGYFQMELWDSCAGQVNGWIRQ